MADVEDREKSGKRSAKPKADGLHASPEAPESHAALARKYRPKVFAELIGQEAMVRTLRNAFASARIAQAYMLTGVRGVGKTTTARLIARALNYEGNGGQRSNPRHDRGRRSLPRHPREPASRRGRDGRSLPHRHRRHSRPDRQRALQAEHRPLQGLHHRRGAHALEAGLQWPAQDARGAARAREVHLRHHRGAQGAGDGAVALPALRP